MALFTGAFFVAQVSLIIVAKRELLRHFTGFYGVIQKYWRNKEK